MSEQSHEKIAGNRADSGFDAFLTDASQCAAQADDDNTDTRSPLDHRPESAAARGFARPDRGESTSQRRWQ